jgi:hypothetical protein
VRASVLVLFAAAALLLPGWGPCPSLPWYEQMPVYAEPPAESDALPILADTWWKPKVSATGFEVNPLDGSVTPGKFKTTAFMHLLPAPPDGGGAPIYVYEMWTETAPDTFSFEFGDAFSVAGSDASGNSALAVNCFLGFDLLTAELAANHTGRLTIKVDKQGALKSGKLKTLAGEMVDSTLHASKLPPPFFGSLKVNGTLIDVADLPFTPE